MAIETEVLVIGGGIAGLTAAITAAREGADVRLVSHAESTLGHASGLIDVLGYVPGADDDRPVVDPFDAIERLPAAHPYRRLGADAVREGLSTFDAVAGERYLGGHTDANALVPTHGGTVKPTARYPAGSVAGLASDRRDACFVGFPRLTDFDPGVAADRLAAAGVPFETAAATVPFPVSLRADANVTRHANLLDANEPVRFEGQTVPLRTALAETVAPHIDGAARVGFPAVLGAAHHEAVHADLERILGVDVFEVPMGPPSLPGRRLERLLSDALVAAGGRLERGSPVVDFDASGDAITAVSLDRSGVDVPVAASQFVLATGGLASDGIESDRETVREPLFDCHVPHQTDRYEWFADEVFGEHPFARFGLVVDDDLRPLAADGDPEFANLRAAGAVLGEYDFAAEKSGSGVSIATGHVAGRAAAGEA